MIRRFTCCAALAAAALSQLVAAPLRAADDFGPGFAIYEKMAKEELRSAGNKVWECADDAKKSGFFASAIEQAERALEYDPDHKDAREFLKYVKKDGKWEQDKAAFDDPNNPKNNQRASSKSGAQESEESYQKRFKKWEEESLLKTNKFVAARYAALGDQLAAKGHPDQAKKGYETALRWDKENAGARKGLGYTKFGKVWITKKQDEARKAASKAEEVKEEQPSQWEDFFKIKMNKIESAHIRIESPFPLEELHEHCKAAETAYAYYLADFGDDPNRDIFDGGRSEVIIVSTEEQWNAAVDAFSGDKEFTRPLGGFTAGGIMRVIRGGTPATVVDKGGGKKETLSGSTAESRRDLIVHGLIHQMNARVWKIDGDTCAWLDEGLAYYFSLKVLESCGTHCVARKTGNYAKPGDEGGHKAWDDPFGWKALLKDQVKKKNDTALRTISMLPLTKLDFRDTVKAWAVATWLMDTDRDKFISCLDQMLDPAVKQEHVFQGTYGKGWEDIDEDWHKYALKCY